MTVKSPLRLLGCALLVKKELSVIIKQKIVRNVCLTAHPIGCAVFVNEQIRFLENRLDERQKRLFPKRVLIIGGSTGYGLATRLVSAINGKAATINVSFEREAQENKVATPGWYNTKAFEKEAKSRSLYAKSIFGDAYSDEVKEEVATLIAKDLGQVDLVVYSLASPMRIDPKTKEIYKSVIKPIGKPFEALSVNVESGIIEKGFFEAAEQEQVEQTVKVMGGEDWVLWIDYLKKRNLLAKNVKTVAFSYIGPELTYPIYRSGTIGKAKEHLENSAFEITKSLKELGGEAYVSVNKALVTRASAVIPVVPLYIALLYKVMKEKGVHEECTAQIYRLFNERLYSGNSIVVDTKGRIRIDDWEMAEEIQKEVLLRWLLQKEGEPIVYADLEGFTKEYANIHGFGYDSIDYDKDIDPRTV